jgi:GGDEF domain-containing protein
MNPENVFYIFQVHPQEKGDLHRSLLARFTLENGRFEILEDHGLPAGLESMPASKAARIIERYTNSMYFEVVNMHDLIQGHHKHLIPEVGNPNGGDIRKEVAANATEPEVTSGHFEYDRIGGEGPRTLSIADGKVFLDGQELSEAEIERVKAHVKEKKAFLRNVLKKGESIFNPGMDPRMQQDSLVPGMGNLKAYRDYHSKAQPGLHIHVNLHDTRHLNGVHGHEAGNAAIAAAGRAIKNVAEQLVGRSARTFRLGGDKFAVHVPSAEAAALYARGLRQHLESIPSVNGTHNFAASIGVGANPEDANIGMMSAREQKRQIGAKPGQSKSQVVMNLPSFRGSF